MRPRPDDGAAGADLLEEPREELLSVQVQGLLWDMSDAEAGL